MCHDFKWASIRAKLGLISKTPEGELRVFAPVGLYFTHFLLIILLIDGQSMPPAAPLFLITQQALHVVF